MSDSVHDLLIRGIAAAKAKDYKEAQFYLEWVLRLPDASFDQKAEAWLWLSQTTDDPARRRDCLENVLAIDPSHPMARRGLAILDGKLKPEDQIDHRQPVKPVQPSATPDASSVRRYVCPKCGGKMTFDANRRALTCTYCGNRMWEYEAIQQGALVQEQDFAATLPTAPAQRWELPIERILTCQSCGAIFTLPPGQVTGACPFCASAHLVASGKARELIQPGGVLPFQFDVDRARKIIRDWLERQRFRPDDLDERAAIESPRGVYLPYWTFDVGGEVKWRGLVQEGSGQNARWVPRTGSHIVYHNDLLVTGTHSLSLDLLNRLADFDTDAIVPYTHDAIAGWSTEVYQVSMADASLVARQRAFREAKTHITDLSLGGESVQDLTVSSLGLVIESFKLVLLPVWIAGYRYKGKRHALVVNGQSGNIVGDVPRSGFQKLMAGLFGD
ncbi:MAG TPA: TFIIB-type zinc ribbon-containing protein [Anaerolineae bacterium]